jgi:hypothetical protein
MFVMRKATIGGIISFDVDQEGLIKTGIQIKRCHLLVEVAHNSAMTKTN